jgi:hypothetical protein
MTQRILGPEGSKRRWRFRYLSLPVLAAIALALLLAGSAGAVHDLTFQLEGNTVAGPPTNFGGNVQAFDWESFFSNAGVASPALPAASRPGYTASSFTRDFRANPGCSLTATGTFCTADSSTFSTGSKDTLDVTPGWQCGYSNNVNSKTDLSNVYALAYTNPAGRKFIYFALERNDNSGDGNVAFWFLQDNVGCTATAGGGNVPFTGHHKDGDVLVVSAFTNGGSVSNVTAYRWNDADGTGPNPGSLGANPIAQGGDCKTTTGTDATCATVNVPTITVPWLTANKTDGVQHNLRESEFFEGGLDLTASGLADRCFSSYLGDTRSSQSLTATIFDYAGGSFQQCGANISITPSGVNEVGTPHTFHVHITTNNAGSVQNAPDGTTATVTITDQNTNTITPTSNTCASPGTVNGDCTVTVNSSTAAVLTAHASTSFTFQGQTLTAQTNGQGGNSGDAVKRYVDASVSITPNGVNEVGHSHTFTISTTALPSGTTPSLNSLDVTVTPAPDSQSACVPTGTGNTRTCTVTINNATAGTFTANATASWHFVDGDSGATPSTADVTRTTDSTHGSSGSVTKTFEDARISIAPSATNEVGQNHTFTVTFSVNRGDGNGFVAESGASCTISLSNSNGAAASPAGPFTGTTNASGQFAATFTSATAGQVVGNGSCSKTVNTVLLTRDTDPATATIGSGPGGSGPATKTFVDAKITIGPPTATNTVGDPHSFLVTVSQDDGLTAAQGGDGVTGFGPAPSNTQVSVSLVNSDGAAYTLTGTGDLCANPGTSGGTCTVTFTSATAGTVTGNASVILSVGGVSLTRDTDSSTASSPCGGGLQSCGPAVKHFVAGSIAWTKVDNATPPRFQGGATFSLCKTANYVLPSGPFVDLQTPDCTFGPVVDNTGQANYTGKDSDPIAGKFKVIGLSLGRYEVHETIAPAGYIADPDTVIVELTPGDTDQVISEAFVNSRPILKITGFGYTNAPEGDPQPDGIFKGATTYTINMHNYGTAPANLTNSSLAVSNAAPGTGLTCDGGNTLSLTGTSIAAGDDSGPISLTCHYDHPDGKAITALLTVSYTTNGFEYHASGSPATITFTVDPNSP